MYGYLNLYRREGPLAIYTLLQQFPEDVSFMRHQSGHSVNLNPQQTYVYDSQCEMADKLHGEQT